MRPNRASSSWQASRRRSRSYRSGATRPSSLIRLATRWMWSLPVDDGPCATATHDTWESKPNRVHIVAAVCCHCASLRWPSCAGIDTTRW